MKKLFFLLYLLLFLVGFGTPSFAQKKIMIISDQTTSNQFVFKEGGRITFKTYGKNKFIWGTILQLNDTFLILRGNKFSDYYKIPIDSISSVKKIKGGHIFTRCLSAIYSSVLIYAIVKSTTSDSEWDVQYQAIVPVVALVSLPWIIPARVLYIGEKYKIEIRNE